MSDKEYEVAVELMLQKVELCEAQGDAKTITIELDRTNELNVSFFERAKSDIRLAHVHMRLCDPTPATEYAGSARHTFH